MNTARGTRPCVANPNQQTFLLMYSSCFEVMADLRSCAWRRHLTPVESRLTAFRSTFGLNDSSGGIVLFAYGCATPPEARTKYLSLSLAAHSRTPHFEREPPDPEFSQTTQRLTRTSVFVRMHFNLRPGSLHPMKIREKISAAVVGPQGCSTGESGALSRFGRILESSAIVRSRGRPM